MRMVRCGRCHGDGWVATGPMLPDAWMPGDEWPAEVHGWNKQRCPACQGIGQVLTEARREVPATPRPAELTPAAQSKAPQPGGLFGAR
jgi:hypothetical protein